MAGLCWYRRRLRGGRRGRRRPGTAPVRGCHERGRGVARRRAGGRPPGRLPAVRARSRVRELRPGAAPPLAVRLDNRDNPITGPKPLAQLDFNMYHGLYRPVYLMQKDRLRSPTLAGGPSRERRDLGHLPDGLARSRHGAGAGHVRNGRAEPARSSCGRPSRRRMGASAATALSPPSDARAGRRSGGDARSWRWDRRASGVPRRPISTASGARCWMVAWWWTPRPCESGSGASPSRADGFSINGERDVPAGHQPAPGAPLHRLRAARRRPIPRRQADQAGWVRLCAPVALPARRPRSWTPATSWAWW